MALAGVNPPLVGPLETGAPVVAGRPEPVPVCKSGGRGRLERGDVTMLGGPAETEADWGYVEGADIPKQEFNTISKQ